MFKINFDAEKHRYTDVQGELPSVTTILGEVGFFQKSQYKWGSAERGHDLHSLFQFYDEGTLDWGTVDEKYLPYLTQYDLAMKEVGRKWMGHEIVVGSQQPRFAGTIDKLDVPCCNIGEIKTGRKERWHLLQVAAYWKAYEMFHEQSELGGAFLIYVHAEDHEVIEIKDVDAEWEVFKACLSVYNWKKNRE